jgi:hypothetical protein
VAKSCINRIRLMARISAIGRGGNFQYSLLGSQNSLQSSRNSLLQSVGNLRKSGAIPAE